MDIFKEILKDGSFRTGEPRMVIKSNLFKSIFKNALSLKWVDIENEYFNELYHIIAKSNSRILNTADRLPSIQNKIAQVERLNEDIDYLQEILITYLKEQETLADKNRNYIEQYSDYFYESIYEGQSKVENNSNPSKYLFLNFNYTNTLNKYLQGNKCIYIHGTLYFSPIFGFGDDTSEKYIELENENINEVLTKFKSFKYLDNNNYAQLVQFLHEGNFQVHIYGHSCGISDRTLLKQIFESKYCTKIKIFYHTESDFEEKKFEISRHFGDKVNFLNKVLDKNNLRKMPQMRNETYR